VASSRAVTACSAEGGVRTRSPARRGFSRFQARLGYRPRLGRPLRRLHLDRGVSAGRIARRNLTPGPLIGTRSRQGLEARRGFPANAHRQRTLVAIHIWTDADAPGLSRRKLVDGAHRGSGLSSSGRGNAPGDSLPSRAASTTARHDTPLTKVSEKDHNILDTAPVVFDMLKMG
jgi:hypothetical protein